MEDDLSNFDLGIKPTIRPQDEPDPIPDYVMDNASNDFVLYITDTAINGIRSHVRHYLEEEVGGVLVGKHFETDNRYMVLVSKHIPVPTSSSSVTHFDFDETALLDLISKLKHEKTDYIVGWYHSHVSDIPAFMSHLDLNVHNSYFPHPWYVSCVVSGSEWALPVRFWRMIDEQLIEIYEYYIHMTYATTAQEQSQRFVRACILEETPVNQMLSNITSLIKNLGVKDFFLPISTVSQEESPTANLSHDLKTMSDIIDLVYSAGSEQTVLEKIYQLKDYLKGVRTLDNSATLALASDKLNDQLVVYGDRAVTFSSRSNLLIICDFVDNVYWPLQIVASNSPQDIDFSDDGTLWVLMSDNKLGYINSETISNRHVPHRKSDLYLNVYISYEFDTEPQQIVAGKSKLWVRSRDSLLCFNVSQNTNQTKLVSLEKTVFLTAENCVITRDLATDVPIGISISDGYIAKLSEQGNVSIKSPLPPRLHKTSLVDVECSSIGLYIILEDEDNKYLVLFSKENLKLVSQYVILNADLTHLSSIYADSIGRTFAKLGKAIYLISETGSVPKHWYQQVMSNFGKQIISQGTSEDEVNNNSG